MLRTLLLLTLAIGSAGCVQLSLFGLGGTKLVEATRRNPVIEVVCLWEPAEGNDLNGLPTRGFAGQVLFFTPGSPQSAKVDGDIRIYVFDDVGNTEERSRPIRQFDFDAGSWNALMRDSDLGASYQLFVPYTRPGQFQANCSVRVRFTPKEGGSPIYSKIAPVALPGRPRPDVVQDSQPEGSSVPLPAGAPARTEWPSAGESRPRSPAFTLPNAASQQLQQQRDALNAAAASAARETAQD